MNQEQQLGTRGIIDEPEETEYVAEDGTKTEQIKINIPLGETKDDKLAGQMIELIVNESTDKMGKKRKNYTIGEAVKILAELDKANQKIKEELVK